MLSFLKKNKVVLKMPVNGKVINLSGVPDLVFSQKMLGDGFAIEPSDGVVYSPINARVIQKFPTNHAIGLETKDGLEILIHFGIDTVELITPIIFTNYDKIKKFNIILGDVEVKNDCCEIIMN